MHDIFIPHLVWTIVSLPITPYVEQMPPTSDLALVKIQKAITQQQTMHRSGPRYQTCSLGIVAACLGARPECRHVEHGKRRGSKLTSELLAIWREETPIEKISTRDDLLVSEQG